MNPTTFRGTGVALVTPFFSNGKIDFSSLEKLIEHVVAGGVEHLVALGTTGEAATLSEKEQRTVIDFIRKTNAGRLPLSVGVFGGSDTAALVSKMKKFDFAGIDALLCASPSYSKPSQEGIFQHYQKLAAASPLPIIIYNVPSRTASNLTAETTLRLAHSSEKFVAVKDASDDMMQIMRIIRDRPPHFSVLSGDDFLSLAIVASGGQGVVSVMANALPRQFSGLIRDCLAGDFSKAQPVNLQLLDLYKLLFSEGNPVGIKAALEHLGICRRDVRLPLTAMSKTGREAIKKAWPA